LTKSKWFRFIVAQKWACLGLLLSVVAAFIASTYLAQAIYFDDPKHQNVTLRAWMTPRYVAHSYDVPRRVVIKTLEIADEEDDHPRRMDVLAQRLELSLPELTEKLRADIAVFREQSSENADDD
jgi:hypothetical protein